MDQSELEANTCTCKLPVSSAGKNVRVRHDWFWFCFSLVEKVARILVTNHRAQQSKREISFDTQLKTALLSCATISLALGHHLIPSGVIKQWYMSSLGSETTELICQDVLVSPRSFRYVIL